MLCPYICLHIEQKLTSLLFLFSRRGDSFLLFGRRCVRSLLANWQAQRALHVILNAKQHFRMILKSLLRILAALAQAFAFVREPSATLFDYAIVRSEIEQVAFARNAFAVHDVELGLAERRPH